MIGDGTEVVQQKTTPTGRAGFDAWCTNLNSNAELRRTPTEACGPHPDERFHSPTASGRYLSPDPVTENATVWGSQEPVIGSVPPPRLNFSCSVSVRRSVNSSGSYVHTNRTVTVCQPLLTSSLRIGLISGKFRPRRMPATFRSVMMLIHSQDGRKDHQWQKSPTGVRNRDAGRPH